MTLRPTLSGAETVTRLLLLRAELDERDGLRTATMVSGYPGSPLGTVDLMLDKLGEELPKHRIEHRPGLNEELAAATVWGSQMGAVIGYRDVDGVVGAWYGKGPGLDRSGDALKHANAMGAGPNGGAVVFCGDDPGSKSSTLACDSQYTFADACIPVLYPADQQEVLDLGVHAFRMSRYAGTWTGVKIVTAVADGAGQVDLSPDRQTPSEPVGFEVDGAVWQHRPLATIGPHAVPDQEALVVDRRLRAAQEYARVNGIDRVVGAGTSLGIVCAGKTYLDVVQALSELGVDDLDAAGIRILKLGLTYPIVEPTALEFAASVDELLVVEEKRPFVETQLRSVLHEAGSRVPLSGKRDRSGARLVSSTGELDPGAVATVLTRVLPALERVLEPVGAVASSRGRVSLPLLPLALPNRAPGFCSGCPHNRSTVAPAGALVGGGVGCHGIMYFEARQQDTKRLPPTPMGAEGVPWIGLSPFVDEPHVIQNLGDGTLSHSGSLAIRASVAAGVNVTFKILYNAAVAMTGGQEVTGLMNVPAMTRALEAEGVQRIVVVAEDPKHYGRRARWAPGVKVFHRDELDRVQVELREVAGVSVIVYDQQCAAEARRLRKRGEQAEPPKRVVINEAVCEGCGDCGAKSNCLSVLPHDTEFGDKRQIHDPSCNRDYTCLDGDCPSFVTITPKRARFGAVSRMRTVKARDHVDKVRAVLPGGTLPEPVIPPLERRFGVYFTGIGGTGVVTAGRIIANAAEAAGLATDGLDQTGLSQKAGAVVSMLHLMASAADRGSAGMTAGGADLYLSGDILQAAAANHLAKTEPGVTQAVVDNVLTPTSAMLQSGVQLPDTALLEAAIADRVGADRAVFIDAKGIAEGVFHDHLLANVVLIGAAYQRGALPLRLADLEKAMRGRSGSANREAFTWGRWAVHDPAAVHAALAASGAGPRDTVQGIVEPSPSALAAAGRLVGDRKVPGEVALLLTRRAAQVVDFQDERLAGRFLDLVERVTAQDSAEHEWALTRAVAESWFKLLTYKDEYEVARLHLAGDYDRVARDLGIEGDYTVKYNLHPPTLRRMGLGRKLPMGRPYALAFQALSRMKRLRGTRLDLFGLDPDRRLERELIAEYATLMDETAGLPYDRRVRIAASAQSIRGYAVVKDRNVAAWREQVASLREPAPAPASAER